MTYRWTFRKKPNEDTIQILTKSLKIPKTLATVLGARGIYSVESAEKYFKPAIENLYDPFLMLDMEKATERILRAIDKKEPIWIHGDYDVDGTTSTAMMLLFLREIGGVVDYFIPDRFVDGYGLSEKSIDLAIEAGSGVLLSVDVGITALPQIKYATSKGLDLIVCDHHEPTDELPVAYAILNPIQPNCEYPFKHLSACGVAFKLIQALAIKVGKPELAIKYLDFVALSSVADMVPLYDENRTLVHFGLNSINESPRPGLKGLIHCTRLKIGSITSSNIVFALAPIINAAGRMGAAMRSVEMMIQDDEFSAFHIAQQLEDENRKRRVFDHETFEESIPMAEEQVRLGRKCIVLHKNDWHPGVIGIVASRLVDRFNKPTVLMTTIDGIAKGSARSIIGFDIHKAIKKAHNMMIEYGGHKHAAGLSMPIEFIDEFREIFDAQASQIITSEMLTPEILIDAELSLNELSPNFFTSLNKFSPFGFENTKPVFYSRKVMSQNGVKVVGQNNLKFRAIQNNFVIDAIAYNLAEKIKICTSGKPFSILYNLEINNFNGNNTPQLYIKDIINED